MSNEVTGPLRRVILKHGDHEAQEGRPGKKGGSQPGYKHVGSESSNGANGAGGRNTPLSEGHMISMKKWEAEEKRGYGINESGRIFTESGEVIESIDEVEYGLSFSPTEMSRLKKDVRLHNIAFVVSHTHPTQSTLSTADVVETMWDDAAEIRAISDNFVFRMGFNTDADFDQQAKFSDFVRDNAEGIFDRVDARVKDIFEEEGRPNMRDADLREIARDEVYSRAINEIYRPFWKRAAERFPEVIKYYIEEPR